MEDKKVKALIISNYSKALTGFGKNAKNVLIRLSKDKDIEVVEAANGAVFGADLRTPWKSYGTYPSDPAVLQKVRSDPREDRLAQYGNYTIDEIIKLEKPDVVIGIEDVWAFDWAKRPWLGKINSVIWTTLDSSPILDQAYYLAPKVDKFLVWASFAEKEMRAKGFDVETLHGAIDYSHFYKLDNTSRNELRSKFGLQDDFVVGFVFKNQLRKSVPNLLEGFKLFQQSLPEGKKAKLLLHSDWRVDENTWDIQKYIEEKGINNDDILATYICKKCKNYYVKPYRGENIDCDCCGASGEMVTKSNLFGLSELQLNDIYNLMDVYCHPFTSGGQEIPIQEAKAAGLITLVTEYSCGLDSCYEKDGGIPLKWAEYREPITHFIKATTLPDSIADSLFKVYFMSEEEKERYSLAAQESIRENFCVDKTVARLKEIILELGKTDWDFDFEGKEEDPNYVPDSSLEDKVWLKDLYLGIFHKKFKDEDVEIREGLKIIEKDGRQPVLDYLKTVAFSKLQERRNKPQDITDFFDGEDEKRIAVVCPESAGDILIINSLIGNLKKKHPEYNIYFITKPEFFPMIEDHPDVHRTIPYSNGMDSLLLLEGQSGHKGYFDAAFLPHAGSQRFLNYVHNGDKKFGVY